MRIQKGYTMIELLVVIVIMIVLGTVAISRFGTLQKDQALHGTILNIQSFIRTAQSNATTRVACPDASSGGQTGGAAWIVSFPSTTGIQFTCQLGAASPSLPIRSYTLEPGVVIQNIYDSSSNACFPSLVNLTFAPLYGNVTFSDSGSCGLASTSSIKIRLSNTASGKTKDLLIDKGGAVYEQ